MTGMSVTKQMCILLRATLQLSEELIVSLGSHYDLTVDIFDIHVLTSIASMCSHERGLISHAVDVVCYSSMSCLLEGWSRLTSKIVSSCLLDGVQRTTVAGKGCLLLWVILWLLQAYYIMFLGVMALGHFSIWQVSVFSNIASIFFINSSCPWPRVLITLHWCSTCWIMRTHILLVLLSLWSLRVRWSICWSLWRLSWLWRWLICHLLESISYSWMTLIHRNRRIIFGECRRFLISLDDIFFIVLLMISTECGGWFYKWGSRRFAYAWRLLNKVILQLSLVLITAIRDILIWLPWSSFLDFWVGHLLTLLTLMLHVWRWLLSFVSLWRTRMFTMLLMACWSILVSGFWEGTRNSWIWVKSCYCWFCVWSGHSSLLLHVLMTASSSVAISWHLVLSMVFCSRSISVRKIGSTMRSIISVTITTMGAILAILILMSSSWVCAFARTSLILLALRGRPTLVCCATWSFLLLKYATTHMECRLLKAKIVLHWGLIDSVLWLGFSRLLHILAVNCRAIWEVLMVVCIWRLVDFHRVFHLLSLYRALRLIQMVGMRGTLIHARPTSMTRPKCFRTVRSRSLLSWIGFPWVWVHIATWGVQLRWVAVSVSVLLSHLVVRRSSTINRRSVLIFRSAWGGRPTLWLRRMPSSMTIFSSLCLISILTSLNTWAFNLVYVLFECICDLCRMLFSFSRGWLLTILVRWLVTRILMTDVWFGRSFWRRHHPRIWSIFLSILRLMLTWISVLLDYRLPIPLWMIVWMSGLGCIVRVWSYSIFMCLSFFPLCRNSRCHVRSLWRSSFDFIRRQLFEIGNTRLQSLYALFLPTSWSASIRLIYPWVTWRTSSYWGSKCMAWTLAWPRTRGEVGCLVVFWIVHLDNDNSIWFVVISFKFKCV